MLSQINKAYAFVLFVIAVSLTSISTASRAEGPLPLIVDMQKTAKVAKEHKVPIVLFVTASWCHYCHKLKENIIEPLIETTNIEDYAEFREVILDKKNWHLKDFDGNLTDMETFAAHLNAGFTPTTLFLSPDGNEIAERIVGLTLEEYYPHYLEEGINTSLKKLGNPKRLDINNLKFDR
jgi:thioredoxin-related protein